MAPSSYPSPGDATPATAGALPQYEHWYHQTGSRNLLKIARTGLQPPDKHDGERNYKHTPGCKVYLFGNEAAIGLWDHASYGRADQAIGLRVGGIDSARLKPDREFVSSSGAGLSRKSWRESCDVEWGYGPAYRVLEQVLERIGEPVDGFFTDHGTQLDLPTEACERAIKAMTPTEIACWLKYARWHESFGGVIHDGPIPIEQIEVLLPGRGPAQWVSLTQLDLEHLKSLDHTNDEVFDLKLNEAPPLAPLHGAGAPPSAQPRVGAPNTPGRPSRPG